MNYSKKVFITLLLFASVSVSVSAATTSHKLKPINKKLNHITKLEVVAFVKRLKNYQGKVLSIRRIGTDKLTFTVKYLNANGEFDILKINHKK